MATKLRIPIITFKERLADAVTQRLLAVDSPARTLFQAGGLEFITLPLPTFPRLTELRPLLLARKSMRRSLS